MNDDIDVIMPVYWIDEQYFLDNVLSIFKELPVNNLYIGINNPKNFPINIALDTMKIGFISIDQTKIKTLGKCLAELMDKVETSWFAYVHSDVLLTPHCFQTMKKEMHPRVGIVESERRHFNGKFYYCPEKPFYYYDRSFSGFQIFRKAAIEKFIEKIEDDYIYRNEDLIFQWACMDAGFEYHKTYAMHIHQTTNKEWTFDKWEATKMQVFGLIKYTRPTTPIVKQYIVGPLRNYLMGAKNYVQAVMSFLILRI